MNITNIEWCDITLNPIVGCSPCSPGCDNCYAARFASRMAKSPIPKTASKYAGVTENGQWTGKINTELSCLERLPQKPAKIFIGSMTDIFHPEVQFGTIDEIIAKIIANKKHTFILLTKRPERMREYFNLFQKTIPNLWLGVTVCLQNEVDEKIPILLQTPAEKRFISAEPMLGLLNIEKYLSQKPNQLDWVICGAETGPGARHMNLDWARYLRDQCKKAEVPFFFKKASGKEVIPPDLMIRQFPEV